LKNIHNKQSRSSILLGYIISAVYTKYNLDPYDNKPASAPDYQAILAWDNDMVIRAYISFPLGW